MEEDKMKVYAVSKTFPSVIIISLLCLGVSAKDEDGRFRESVTPENITVLKSKVHLAGGDLRITGHAEKTFEADCWFSREQWRPEVFYERRNDEGRLLIEMPDIEHINIDDDEKNIWELIYPERVPLDLKVKIGGGKTDINLANMDIRKFEFSMVGGEVDINLRDTSVPKFEFRALAGEAVVDFSGKWKNDLNAEFVCGFGELTLILPENTAVRVEVDGVIGEVSAPGFERDDDYYVNRIRDTEHLLDISVKGGIGEVKLRLVD